MDFKNTIIIMTSNIGSSHLLDGITEGGEFRPGVRDKVMDEMRRHFRPEFLNRVDEIVMFRPLLPEQIGRIVELLLGKLRGRLAERKITVDLSDAARDFIAESAYDPVYGARPLRRYLQTNVETPLARRLISGDLKDGQHVTIGVRLDKLTFE